MTANFDLRVRAGDTEDTYYVEVTDSPSGQSAAVKQAAPALDAALLSSWESGVAVASEAQQLGELLGAWLFPNAVQERFAASRAVVTANRGGLRLRLRIDPPELSRLPWELAWNANDEFLALSSKLAFTRYIAEEFAASPLGTPAPLTIAILLASPHGLPELNVTQEADIVLKSLEPISEYVKPTIFPNTTWKTLQKVLAEGVDVLHFVGHGGITDGGEGYLALETASGDVAQITASKLRTLFRDRDVKVVVLNACESALSGAQAAIMGVAPSLVRSGVPAVIAHQTPIPNGIARSFSETLYDYLVSGKPLDAAVTEMRLLAFGESEEYAYWGVPVLFMRAPDGRLWQSRDAHSEAIDKADNEQSGGVNISGIENSQIQIGNLAGRDINTGDADKK